MSAAPQLRDTVIDVLATSGPMRFGALSTHPKVMMAADSDFSVIGLLNNMKKRGLLVRDQEGLYAVAPPMLRVLREGPTDNLLTAEPGAGAPSVDPADPGGELLEYWYGADGVERILEEQLELCRHAMAMAVTGCELEAIRRIHDHAENALAELRALDIESVHEEVDP